MPAQKSKRSDPWAALDALFKQEAEPTGPEWFTVADFAARYDFANGTATSKLKEMVADGQLERWHGRGANGYRKLKFRWLPENATNGRTQ